jgi:hypothetical protein
MCKGGKLWTSSTDIFDWLHTVDKQQLRFDISNEDLSEVGANH